MFITVFLCHSLHNFFSWRSIFRNLIVISRLLQCRSRNQKEKCGALCLDFNFAQIVCNSQSTQCAATSRTNRWMWRCSTVAIHCDDHAEHKNTLCGANFRFFNVKPHGIYTDHWSVSGYKMYYRGLDLFGVWDVKQKYLAIAQQLNVITYLAVCNKKCTITERNFRHKIWLIQRKIARSVI